MRLIDVVALLITIVLLVCWVRTKNPRLGTATALSFGAMFGLQAWLFSQDHASWWVVGYTIFMAVVAPILAIIGVRRTKARK
jgi:hypothetical protein